jgi:ribonucleoside-triphosphate reductase
MIEDELISRNYNDLVRAFIKYRYNKELVRKSNTTDDTILSLINLANEELKQENANKNPVVNSTQRDYMAGEVSKDITRRLILPKDVVKAHDEGTIHFHDTDYFIQKMHNCDLVNLEDMLQNGTVISGTLVEKPHSFATACNIATQIIAQVSSNQYGGQSITLSHLAPFVDVSRKKIRAEVEEELKSLDQYSRTLLAADITEKRVRAEVKRGVQTIQYQVNTLLTTNGQAPFITVFMYLNEVEDEQTKKDLAMVIEEVLLQRHEGIKNEKGVWVSPAFPKLVYVLEEDNIREGSEYWELTKLAAKCTAKRLVPDYISEKIMRELKEGGCFAPMGCRSCLSPWYDENGKQKWYGRFNKGVVTVNLVDVACSATGANYAKDLNSFWKNFDEVLELCHKALLCRYERLKGTVSDVAPILWQHGAIARLKKGETIDKLLTGGYSTISLGYAGLWECVVELIGKDLLDEEGQELGLEIMRYMNKKCDEWNKELYLGFGIYGTPLESTTYKFAKCLQKRWGEIPGVTDKNYITNSYHVHVTKEIDPFEKLRVESIFQRLSSGGAISYIESANLENNLEAVLTMIQYIYDNIMYAELNIKSDYCQECGWDREICIVEDESGKLVWECPNCGNRDQSKMNVARRTCGYIGTQFFNQGRTAEIKDRFVHLDCHECGCR